MRADVLDLIADEINARPVSKVASFLKFDGGGRAKLDGMNAGRGRDIDREQREFERASRAELRTLSNRNTWRKFATKYNSKRRDGYRLDPSNRDRRLADNRRHREKETGRPAPGRVVRRWTPAEDAILMEEFATALVSDIAERLGRTTVAVYWRGEALGLRREKPGKRVKQEAIGPKAKKVSP